MEKIVIYGKGGIGKSTVASNLSLVYALQGKKVLQIGCDPKHDSTLRILNGIKIKTVMDALHEDQDIELNKVLKTGVYEIDCLEAGGPPPGVGCAGRGITRMFEFFEEQSVLNKKKYDAVIFDVLGDVVCGGFAAPLKKGFGEKVLIVISEEIMSMYAAKNIVNVINQYKYNGIYLAGLIINKRDNEINNDYLDKFAQKIKADILATMPRSKLIAEAEYKQMTVVQAFPNSAEAELFADLAKKISSIVKQQAKDPVLISDEEFNNLFIK